MAVSALDRFTLDHDGHCFEIETDSAGLHTVARLFVDGQHVDEQKGMEKKITLEGSGLTAVVDLTWLGKVEEILAVPSGADVGKVKVKEEGIAFLAPPGSRAARMETMRREHPLLYAARHVVMAVLQVLVGALGLVALVWGLLPRIAIPAIPLPWPDLHVPAIPLPAITINLPDIPWPDLPPPAIDLPNLSHLAWIKDHWNSVNWLVPIVIAIIVALNEIDKRRKRQKAEAERSVASGQS